MPSRTRTKPRGSIITINNIVERRQLLSTGFTPWVYFRTDTNSAYNSALVSDDMTDTIGQRALQNPCTHVTWVLESEEKTYNLYSPIPSLNNYQYRAIGYKSPADVFAKAYGGHLAPPPGMTTLARARIPATTRSDLQGLINIAELGSTVNSGAVKLVAGLSQLALAAWRGQVTNRQRKRLKKALTEATTVSGFTQHLIGANLEWKFGWKPFLTDLRASMHAFERAAKIRKRLETGYRVYGKSVETMTENVSVPGWGSAYNYVQSEGSYQRTTKCTVTSSIMRRIKSEHTGPDWQLMLPIYLELLGLKPSLSKAWDLVPLSFVVDWVIPIGNMIESMEGMTTPQSNWIESYDGLESTKTETVTVGQLRVKPPCQAASFGCTSKYTSYSRVNSTLTGASPAYLPTNISIPTDFGKWFTGMELLLQRLLK